MTPDQNTTFYVGATTFQATFSRKEDVIRLQLSAPGQHSALATCLEALWNDNPVGLLELWGKGGTVKAGSSSMSALETGYAPEEFKFQIGNQRGVVGAGFLYNVLVNVTLGHMSAGEGVCYPTYEDLPSMWQEELPLIAQPDAD